MTSAKRGAAATAILWAMVSTVAAGTEHARSNEAPQPLSLGETTYAEPQKEPGRHPGPKKILEDSLRGIKPVLDLTLRLGYAYDSNVLQIGRSTPLPRGVSGKADSRFSARADGNLSWVIPLPRVNDPWYHNWGKTLTLGVGGAAAQDWHPSLSEFDLGRYVGRAFMNLETDWEVPFRPGYDQGGIYLGAQFEHGTITLDRDTFIYTNSVTPALTIIWQRDPDNIRWYNEMDRTVVYYRYDRRQFQDEPFDRLLDRDGNYHAIGVQHVMYFVKAEHMWPDYLGTLHKDEADLFYSHEWLQGHIGYEYENHRTHGWEFDAYSNALNWGLHVPLPHEWAFDVDGEFVWANYTNRSIFGGGQERFDFLQRYNFAFTHSFLVEDLGTELLEGKFRAGVELAFQDSNISSPVTDDLYEFNQAIYGVQFEFNWVPTRYGPRGRGTVIPSHVVGPNRRATLLGRPRSRVTQTLKRPPGTGGTGGTGTAGSG